MHLIDYLSLLRSFKDHLDVVYRRSVLRTAHLPIFYRPYRDLYLSIFNFQFSILIRVHINLYLHRLEIVVMLEVFYGLIDKLLDFR